MNRREEAANLTARAVERIEGLLKKAKEHAEAGRLKEAMAIFAVVEEDARMNAEDLAHRLGAEEDLLRVRAAILADVYCVVNP